VSAAYPYRAGDPNANALGDAAELAAELDRTISAAEPRTVAAFVAEPIVGATLGAVSPPDGYWPAIAEVCRRHGVLLVVDEVMTGFGRTGRWFASDHFGIRPDILTAAKGATSGYWPFGFAAASDEVFRTVMTPGPFVHGFTFSHSPVGAAVARTVLGILEAEELVPASAAKGDRLLALLHDRLDTHPHAGEVRGRGLLAGVELVADRDTRAPFARSLKVTEAVVAAARELGVLVYSSTGGADGVDGDLVLLGPPFVITDDELVAVADGVAEAVDRVTAATGAGSRPQARTRP
jgi:adenosylmethionine-8-amino-7-oxononanoate aminotransferase